MNRRQADLVDWPARTIRQRGYARLSMVHFLDLQMAFSFLLIVPAVPVEVARVPVKDPVSAAPEGLPAPAD